MIAPLITAPQRKRLQTLYSQYERHTLDVTDSSRATRMQWASEQTGRVIDSFNGLTKIEAKRLIETLQGILNVKAPNRTPRRQSRKDAEKMGTEGRHDQIHDEVTLAGAHEHELIQRDLTRLGWTEARLEAFLRSPRSPLKGKHTVRTRGEANKLHWALKRLPPAREAIAP